MKFKNQSHTSFQEEDTINFAVFRLPNTKPIRKPCSSDQKKPKKESQKKSPKKKCFKKLSEIKWYDQNKMTWSKTFTEKLIYHSCDFDEESDAELIERAVARGIEELGSEIAFQKILNLEDTQGF